jgi:hypothetical protein
MPLKYPDYQRAFTFEVNGDGLPIGKVITLGCGRWLTVCPLCGCAHDVTTFRGDVYTPNCILKITHPKVYAMWLERFPDAAKYSRVMLKTVEIADLSNSEFLKAVPASKRGRKKAA